MIDVIHTCTGPSCLHCLMARHGYVRSHGGFWFQPDGDGPQLSDDEARMFVTPALFDLTEWEGTSGKEEARHG